MLGSRLKRGAVALAVFVVLMMTFFVMPKEAYADGPMHVTVTTNNNEALERVVAYCYKNWDGPTSSNQAQMTTAPINEDSSKWIDLSWEYPSNISPAITLYWKYKSDDYMLAGLLWNDFDMFGPSDYSMPEDGYYEFRVTEPYTYRTFAHIPWDSGDTWASSPGVWGPEGGYKGNYDGYFAGYCYNGNNPSLENTIQLLFISKEDSAVVDEIKDAINALPDALNITPENKDAITEAREKYDALAPDLRAMIPEETLAKLVGAEKIIELYDQIAQANSDKDQALADLEEANDKLDDAEADLILANADKDQALADLSDAQGKLNDANKAKEKAESDLKDAQEAKDKAEADLKDVKDGKDKAEADLKDAQDAKDKAEKDLKDTQDAKDKAEKDLKDAQDAKAKSEADLKAAQDAKEKAEADLKVAQDAKDKAEADKVAAEKTLNDIKENGFGVIAKVSLGKVKGAKKKLTVNWTKVADAKGYEIIVAKNKKGTKEAKTYTVKKGSAVKKTIKKLAKGKYFVKIRAYKEYNGNTVYGAFSKAKKVKVK